MALTCNERWLFVLRQALALGLPTLIAVLLGILPAVAGASNMSAADNYVWSENMGWIDFSPSGGNVIRYDTHLSGYIWAENAGWIQLGVVNGGPYTNTGGGTDWGVNLDGDGRLSGYAWSETVGWIRFRPTYGGVSIDSTTHTFDGYAWGENIGWIHFKNDDPAYQVSWSNTVPGDVTVADQQTAEDSMLDAVAFAVSDLETSPSNLVVTATSSDASLLPADGIVLGGAGANRTLSLTPTANRYGTVTVTLRVVDGDGSSSTSTFPFTVTPVNDRPIGNILITGTAEENRVLTAGTATLTDIDGLGTLEYQWRRSVAAGTSLTWEVIEGAEGPTYTLDDADVGSHLRVTVSYTDAANTLEALTSTATAVVVNVNDAPIARDDISATVTEDASVAVSLSGTDADGDALTIYVQTLPAHGTLYQTADGETLGAEMASVPTSVTDAEGRVVFVPDQDWNGVDTFTFHVNDGMISNAVAAVVSLTVTAVNDAPVAVSQAVADIDEDTPTTFTLSGTDVDAGDTVVAVIHSLPSNGRLFQTADGVTRGSEISATGIRVTDVSGRVIWVPNGEWSGTDAFTFFLSDGKLEGPMTTQTITVSPLNDPPLAANVVVSINEEQDHIFSVADFGFIDADSEDTLALVEIVSPVTLGRLTLQGGDVVANQQIDVSALADGQLLFSPAVNGNGAGYATFSFRVHDGEVFSADAYTTTIDVTPVNDAPTGTPTIVGTMAEHETLTAHGEAVADVDGLGSLAYQWARSLDGGVTWVDISGAVAATYVLNAADIGGVVRVALSYVDGQGTDERLVSEATDTVINVNDPPVGELLISGTPAQGETLTVSHTLTDSDGLGAVTYQWQRDGVDLADATGNTYLLTERDVGALITVEAHYQDGAGTEESKRDDTVLETIRNVNDLPEGAVTVSGTLLQGAVLTASHTVTDRDGLGTLAYQWLRGADPLEGATDSTLRLTEAHVGHTMAVVVSYTDGHGAEERVTSEATGVVENLDDPVTGGIVVARSEEDQNVLVAAIDALHDADGLGSFTYRWERSVDAGVTWAPIEEATAETYTLSADDDGHAIRVVLTHTDARGTVEILDGVSWDGSPPAQNATLDSHLDGETLTGSEVTLSWQAAGDRFYRLFVGTVAGGSELYNAADGLSTESVTLEALPVDGSTLYVQLWTRIDGTWGDSPEEITLIAHTEEEPAIVESHVDGETLTGSEATLSWQAAGDGLYWLRIGTTPGGGEIYDAPDGLSVESVTVDALPVDGSTLYVQLWTQFDGVWADAPEELTLIAHTEEGEATVPAFVLGLGAESVGFLERLDPAQNWAGTGWMQVAWPAYNTANGETRPAWCDVDGDGQRELVVGLGTGGQGWLQIFDDAAHDYLPLTWRKVPWEAYGADNGETYPACGDLDGDGRDELVVGLGEGSNGWVAMLDDAEAGYALLAWVQVSWPAYNLANGAVHPAVGNFDEDEADEVILGLGGASEGWMQILDDANSRFAGLSWTRLPWAAYAETYGETRPVACNLDEDAQAELVVGLGQGAEGFVAVLDDAISGFSLLAWPRMGWPEYNTNNGETFPACGNWDGDRWHELLLGAGTGSAGWLHMLDDLSTGFVSLGWKRGHWHAYNVGNGLTRPAAWAP